MEEELPEGPSATLDAQQQQQQQQQAEGHGGQQGQEGVLHERPMSRESAGSSDGSGPSDSAQSMHAQLGTLPKVRRQRGGMLLLLPHLLAAMQWWQWRHIAAHRLPPLS